MKRAYTLIEVIIASALIIITAGIALVWIDPSRQFALARNARRTSDITSIINAVGQNIADNRGIFTCVSGAIPAVATKMASGTGNYDIAPCLTPAYLPTLPYDPTATNAQYVSVSNYDTGYTILMSTTTGFVTVAAPSAELGASISITR